MPKVSIIAAMAENRVIGDAGRLPWSVPADLKRFRELTTGHTLVMGRKTFQSIGRPLPGRDTIVLSRNEDFRAEGCRVARGVDEALQQVGEAEEVFICGGAEVYRQTMGQADSLFLTIVHGVYEGDAFFPDIPPELKLVWREEWGGTPPCSFLRFERDGEAGL